MLIIDRLSVPKNYSCMSCEKYDFTDDVCLLNKKRKIGINFKVGK